MKYCIILLIFLASAAYSQTTDLGGPAHSGVYNSKPVREFSALAWKTPVTGWSLQNFIEKDGVLYTSAIRYNAATHSTVGYIYAINSASGSIVWTDSVDQNISSPVLKDDILYCGSDERKGKQFAFDKNTGKQLWSFSTKEASCYPPAICGNCIFFGSHGNIWYELDRKSGALINETVHDTDICCSPSVYKDLVYYVDFGTLHAYDPVNRKDKWNFNFGGKSFSAPAIVDDVLYLVVEEGSVLAISLDGKLLWTFNTGDTTFRSPAVSKGIVSLITTNGHIFALNAKDGIVIWEALKEGKNNWPAYTHPAIADDVVYVGCSDGFLHAFELKTGKELWKFETGLPVGTPVVADGMVYFSSGPIIYAIR